MPSKIRRRLRRATNERLLVRIYRSIPGADRLNGFVLAGNKNWTLMAIEDDARLNGFVAIRTHDVRKVKRRPRSMVKRYLDAHGLWPVPTPVGEIRLDSLAALLDDATASTGLVAVYVERDNPGVCFIGRVVGHRKRSFGLQEVTPKALWKTEATKYRYREVTRVDFGDAYCAALAEVAGEPPPWVE